jgi:hypothetical protein
MAGERPLSGRKRKGWLWPVAATDQNDTNGRSGMAAFGGVNLTGSEGSAPAGRVLSAYARKWRGHDSGNCDHRRQNKLELRWLSQRHGLIPSVLIDLPGLTTRRAGHRVTIGIKLHGQRVTPLGKYSQMCVQQWTHATESLFTSLSHAWTVEPYASITQPSSREAARAFLRALAY